MYNFDQYDSDEFRATMEELESQDRNAPKNIPVAKLNGGWQPKYGRRKFGDLDGLFAAAATRRLRNTFVAEMLYGGEDEMIEALDAAETAA